MCLIDKCREVRELDELRILFLAADAAISSGLIFDFT